MDDHLVLDNLLMCSSLETGAATEREKAGHLFCFVLF